MEFQLHFNILEAPESELPVSACKLESRIFGISSTLLLIFDEKEVKLAVACLHLAGSKTLLFVAGVEGKDISDNFVIFQDFNLMLSNRRTLDLSN